MAKAEGETTITISRTDLEELRAELKDLRRQLEESKGEPRRQVRDPIRLLEKSREIIEKQAKSRNCGPHSYRIAVKNWKRSLVMNCEQDDQIQAIGEFNRRFGTQFDVRKMTIHKIGA